MAIEIVSFPIKNGGSFHSYVKLPDGKRMVILLMFPRKLAQNRENKNMRHFRVVLLAISPLDPQITPFERPNEPINIYWLIV